MLKKVERAGLVLRDSLESREEMDLRLYGVFAQVMLIQTVLLKEVFDNSNNVGTFMDKYSLAVLAYVGSIGLCAYLAKSDIWPVYKEIWLCRQEIDEAIVFEKLLDEVERIGREADDFAYRMETRVNPLYENGNPFDVYVEDVELAIQLNQVSSK